MKECWKGYKFVKQGFKKSKTKLKQKKGWQNHPICRNYNSWIPLIDLVIESHKYNLLFISFYNYKYNI